MNRGQSNDLALASGLGEGLGEGLGRSGLLTSGRLLGSGLRGELRRCLGRWLRGELRGCLRGRRGSRLRGRLGGGLRGRLGGRLHNGLDGERLTGGLLRASGLLGGLRMNDVSDHRHDAGLGARLGGRGLAGKLGCEEVLDHARGGSVLLHPCSVTKIGSSVKRRHCQSGATIPSSRSESARLV